jgi:hypothetical protein
MGTPWSLQEKQTLEAIWKSTASVDSQMSRLPGRSTETAYVVARSIGLPPKPRARTLLRKEIAEFMKDSQPRTASEVATCLSGETKVVRDVLREFVTVDAMHITVELGRYNAAMYRNGPAPAGQPKQPSDRRGARAACAKRCAVEQSETEEEMERRLDAAYRSPARWWPHADPLVVQSMNAMVAAGMAAV